MVITEYNALHYTFFNLFNLFSSLHILQPLPLVTHSLTSSPRYTFFSLLPSLHILQPLLLISDPSLLIYPSITECMRDLSVDEAVDKVWLVGGAGIYKVHF